MFELESIDGKTFCPTAYKQTKQDQNWNRRMKTKNLPGKGLSFPLSAPPRNKW